jgi:hypothetical protein
VIVYANLENEKGPHLIANLIDVEMSFYQLYWMVQQKIGKFDWNLFADLSTRSRVFDSSKLSAQLWLSLGTKFCIFIVEYA